MKKRMKGLVCLWLAVVMVFGMAITVMADSGRIRIYTGDKALEDSVEYSDQTEVPVAFGTPLNQQESIMDAVAYKADHVLSGWKLWEYMGSGHITNPRALAVDAVLGESDLDEHWVDILEPLWNAMYRIYPQPTDETLTVGSQVYDETDGWKDTTPISYQWYLYNEVNCEVVWENPSENQIAIEEYWDGSYSEEDKVWVCDAGGEIDILIPVEAGDVIKVTPVGDNVGNGDVMEYYDEIPFEKKDGAYFYTIEEDRYFDLWMTGFNADATFRIEVIRLGVGEAAAGQTTKKLKAGIDGQQYVCKVKFSENTTLTSDPVTYRQPADDGFDRPGSTYWPIFGGGDCPRGRSCPMYYCTDLDLYAWYHDGIHYCMDEGLMTGTGSDAFAPDAAATRAMIVTILWRLESCPTVNDVMSFADVAADTWYTEAVRWAASENIVEGYSDTAFGPNDAITREQLAAILWRYCKHMGRDVYVGESTDILSYVDGASVSEYAIAAVQWACDAELMEGAGGKLMPQSNATRAQLAAILERLLNV